MGKDKGTRYTNDEREELLALYRQSGYGVSRFCKEMDISYATLKRWLGRESRGVSFVEVAADPAAAVPASLSVRLANGISCELGYSSRDEAIHWIRELKRC